MQFLTVDKAKRSVSLFHLVTPTYLPPRSWFFHLILKKTVNKLVKGFKELSNIKQNRAATLSETAGVSVDCSLFSYTEDFSFKKGSR